MNGSAPMLPLSDVWSGLTLQISNKESKVKPERVGGFRFLDSRHDEVIDTEAGSHCKNGKREIWDNTDDGEQCKWQEHKETAAEYYGRLLDITPQKHVLHYRASKCQRSVKRFAISN